MRHSEPNLTGADQIADDPHDNEQVQNAAAQIQRPAARDRWRPSSFTIPARMLRFERGPSPRGLDRNSELAIGRA
jgi:hypothetical protein